MREGARPRREFSEGRSSTHGGRAQAPRARRVQPLTAAKQLKMESSFEPRRKDYALGVSGESGFSAPSGVAAGLIHLHRGMGMGNRWERFVNFSRHKPACRRGSCSPSAPVICTCGSSKSSVSSSHILAVPATRSISTPSTHRPLQRRSAANAMPKVRVRRHDGSESAWVRS